MTCPFTHTSCRTNCSLFKNDKCLMRAYLVNKIAETDLDIEERKLRLGKEMLNLRVNESLEAERRAFLETVL